VPPGGSNSEKAQTVALEKKIFFDDGKENQTGIIA
jgi:hypothetical protein